MAHKRSLTGHLLYLIEGFLVNRGPKITGHQGHRPGQAFQGGIGPWMGQVLPYQWWRHVRVNHLLALDVQLIRWAIQFDTKFFISSEKGLQLGVMSCIIFAQYSNILGTTDHTRSRPAKASVRCCWNISPDTDTSGNDQKWWSWWWVDLIHHRVLFDSKHFSHLVWRRLSNHWTCPVIYSR